MSTSRTYCAGCGTYRFKEAHELCFHCQRGSTVEGETEAASVISPITFGGHEIDAPDFTSESYERAIARALVDRLEVQVDPTGQHIVCHAGVNGGYSTTRHTCSCKAGQVGTPCKHRAALIAHLDIREPVIRRQWQAAEHTRSAVAA